MGRRSRIIQAFAIITFLVMILDSFALFSFDGSPPQVTSIEAAWSSQESSAATSRLTYFKTFVSCSKEAKFSVEDIEEIVNGLKFSTDENFRSELIQKFNPELFERHQGYDQTQHPWKLWEKRTLITDGFRERSTGSGSDHVLDRGLHLLHDERNHEISCYERGQCEFHYHQLDWFLGVLPVQALKNVVSVEENEGVQTLHWKSGSWLTVDAEHHLPVDEESVNPSGEIVKRAFFREQASYPGDVMLPALRIEVSFRKSHARNLVITIVDDAQFNGDIPESEFVMSATAKTAMADMRSDQRSSRRAEQAVADSAEYFLASGLVANVAAPAVPQAFHWKAFFLILNGVVLIVLGVVLWRRAR